MADFLIDGYTDTFRKSPVFQGRRLSTVFYGKLMHDGVDFIGLDPRADFILDPIKSIQHQFSGLANAFNIGFFFKPNFVSLGIQRPGLPVKLNVFSQTALFMFYPAAAGAGIVSTDFHCFALLFKQILSGFG
jgi:hypothetical protein